MLAPPKKAQTRKKTQLNSSESVVRNAKEVSLEIQNKRQEQTKHFRKILELCQIEITKSVELGYTHCIFEVPEFLLGFPLYDINECIVYILRKLQENDYQVSYYFPKTIYITWPVEETQDDKINNTFLNILNSIQQKHTSPSPIPVSSYASVPNTQTQSNPFISTSHPHINTKTSTQQEVNVDQLKQIMGVFMAYNNQQINENNSSYPQIPYLSPQKATDIERWNDNAMKIVQNSKTEKNKPKKIERIEVKNNDEIKKVMQDPFYLFDKTVHNDSKNGNTSLIKDVDVKSEENEKKETTHSTKEKQEVQENAQSQTQIRKDLEKETKNDQRQNLNQNKKERGKGKKEVKPISELRNKKIVLDLTS